MCAWLLVVELGRLCDLALFFRCRGGETFRFGGNPPGGQDVGQGPSIQSRVASGMIRAQGVWPSHDHKRCRRRPLVSLRVFECCNSRTMDIAVVLSAAINMTAAHN